MAGGRSAKAAGDLSGAPVLLDAAAWLDCTIDSRHPAGTHTIYAGAVQATSVPQPEGAPLLRLEPGCPSTVRLNDGCGCGRIADRIGPA